MAANIVMTIVMAMTVYADTHAHAANMNANNGGIGSSRT